MNAPTLKETIRAGKLVCCLFLMILLAGCSIALEKNILVPQNPIPESRKFTVAVLPFGHPAPGPDSEEKTRNRQEKPDNPEMKSFERQYFPSRLVQTLRQSPWVREAYAVPGKTPSVDYTIRGDVKESDGEVTEVVVTVTRCCYHDVFSKSFRIDLSSSDFKEMTDPGSTLWNSIVNTVGRYFDTVTAEENSNMINDRSATYAQGAVKNVGVTPRSLETLAKAARWERENLLARVSTMAISFADEITPIHVKWQEKVTKTAEEKRQKDLQTGVQTLMAITNVGLGMYASANGVGGLGSYFALAAGGNIMNAV
jgi:hypothetical protein